MATLAELDAILSARKGGGSQMLQVSPSQMPAHQSVNPLSMIDQELERRRIMQQEIDSMSGVQKFLTGVGRGITSIGRAVGLGQQPDELEQQAFQQLKESAPKTVGAGQFVGEVAPFLPAGVAAGAIRGLGARAATVGGLGAAEGGIVSKAQGGGAEEQITSAGLGGAIAGGLELALPVVGRLGGALVRRVTGKAPSGAVIDQAGRPTPELQNALNEAGLKFEDLVQDAQEAIRSQPQAVPQQAARQALFKQEQIPASTGDITQKFTDQATEQRLLQSASDPVAEQFRQFKLTQSNAIRTRLSELLPDDADSLQTGELIKDALTGRKNLLRSTKNSLYREAGEKTKNVGGIPLFTDEIKSVIPDADEFEDLAITAPQAIESINKLLTKYGLKDPTQEMIKAGFKPSRLTVENFERFRKTLNAIERGDNTGAASVVTGKLKTAIDEELINLADNIGQNKLPPDVVSTLKEARKTTMQLKKEFSPQSLAGRLSSSKKDGVTNFIEASQVYNKLASKAQPVENIRKVMTSLNQSGAEGAQAISALQSSVVMDLIDSGFSTASRKVDGVPVFNPTAFKKKIKTIGDEKLKEIFGNNQKVLNRIKNIDKIASSLIPEGGAVPKGSAPVILELAQKLGVMSMTQKLPGGYALTEAISSLAKSGRTRQEVEQALRGTPEILKVIEDQYPNIARFLLPASRATAPAFGAESITSED